MNFTAQETAQLITDFEWLHAHPELPYEEVETTAYVRAALEAAGVPILPYEMKTGLVAEICGEAPAQGARGVVALRADIDALPVTEACALPYASQNEGKMHACGHDFHTAVLLSLALKLWRARGSFSGTVRCMFQPAEEAGFGAREVLNTPAMQGVDAVFALHTSPLYPAGTIILSEGAVSASVNRFEIKVKGYGCHAAYPERSVDAVVVGAAIVSALQSVVSRNVAPLSSALVSVTQFEAGNTWNVIPETAYLQGTVRTLSTQTQALVETRMRALAKGIAESYGASAELLWHEGPPPTNNDPYWTGIARDVATSCGLALAQDTPSMLGDDFACYQELAPGVYIHAGIGEGAPNHNPKFMVDEDSLSPAATYLTALTLEALQKIAAEKQ